MNKLFLSIAVLFLSIAAIYYIGVRGTYSTDLKVADQNFLVQIVDTDVGRQQGLSGRYSMCDRCGMLFVFDDISERRFWMKDMKFDIDIIFIDADKKIVKIYENVDRKKFPETYEANAKYVFELKSGVAKSSGIVVGDVIDW
jgi:uncharacterized membrane protein (UPF0127 family)